jgi:putative two-component system response regulator
MNSTVSSTGFPAGPAYAGVHGTVLIVDDTAQNLTVLGELLQPHYRVRAANSGARALRAAGMTPRPDLILLDVMMPGMDGHEVLRRLREDPATRTIPVIFITAMDSAESEEQGLALGAVDYIVKPFSPAVVLARVRTQLELKHARDRLTNQNEWLEHEVERRMRENLLIQDLSMRALACLAADTSRTATDTARRWRGGAWIWWSRLHHCTILARSGYQTPSCSSRVGSLLKNSRS